MHELSIVDALVKQCEKVAHENDATKINVVHVKIGILSGVEPYFLKSTYDTFREGTICENAELDMKIQNIVVRCNECGETNELTENVFMCPKCKSDDIQVIDGEDMMLMQLEME